MNQATKNFLKGLINLGALSKDFVRRGWHGEELKTLMEQSEARPDPIVDRNKRTKVIELYGAPGSGKSKTAARLFADIENSELCREYVKDMVYESADSRDLHHSFFLFGEQTRRESRLYGQVDYIITDSPLWLQVFYNTSLFDAAFSFIQSSEGCVERIPFLLQRNVPYLEDGRFQNEKEADEVADELEAFLRYNVKLDVTPTLTTQAYPTVLNRLDLAPLWG